tara:strand:- start:829 stop:1041 length:213 start_codon:yes stop_codon:yes gene_type:complete
MSKSILIDTFDAIIGELPRLATMAMQEERARVVTWLRAQSQLTLYEATPDDVADAIERGEHVKEVTDGPA